MAVDPDGRICIASGLAFLDALDDRLIPLVFGCSDRLTFNGL